jgi:uncharacterized membrane protein
MYVNVVCCQVEVTATCWFTVQRSTTDCGASLCVNWKRLICRDCGTLGGCFAKHNQAMKSGLLHSTRFHSSTVLCTLWWWPKATIENLCTKVHYWKYGFRKLCWCRFKSVPQYPDTKFVWCVGIADVLLCQSPSVSFHPMQSFLTLSLLMSYIYGAPSKTRNLTSYIYIYIYMNEIFTGDFLSWTVHFVNICVKNQQIHQLFIQFINYLW